MSNWIYRGKEFDPVQIEKNIGFVYIIHNLVSDKKYVGKKLFTFSKIRQVNKKKKKSRVDSDWKTYYGSNDQLNLDVESLGEENFTREILHLGATKGTCNYLEAYEIMTRNAIISDNFYNSWLSVKVSRSQVKIP